MPSPPRVALTRDPAPLAALLADPDLASHYDAYAGAGGAERMLGDEHVAPDSLHVAHDGDVPVGFVFAVLLPGPNSWSLVRGGVLPSHRRRGIGRALLEHMMSWLRTQRVVPGLAEVTVGAWEPHAGVRALVEPLGFRSVRTFWRMDRPRGATVPAPVWPVGVTTREPADDADLVAWNDAYNASFAEAYRFVAGTPDETRALAARPGFRRDGLRLAFLDGRIAGFAYNVLHPGRGEVATLGTLPHARGLGLGRALLRWSVGWLEQSGEGPVTLLVEGGNENALRLYRSEGFVVRRTRGLWARPLEAA